MNFLKIRSKCITFVGIDHIYTSAPVQSQYMPSVAQRVLQITWQSEDDIYGGLQ